MENLTIFRDQQLITGKDAYSQLIVTYLIFSFFFLSFPYILLYLLNYLSLNTRVTKDFLSLENTIIFILFVNIYKSDELCPKTKPSQWSLKLHMLRIDSWPIQIIGTCWQCHNFSCYTKISSMAFKYIVFFFTLIA